MCYIKSQQQQPANERTNTPASPRLAPPPLPLMYPTHRGTYDATREPMYNASQKSSDYDEDEDPRVDSCLLSPFLLYYIFLSRFHFTLSLYASRDLADTVGDDERAEEFSGTDETSSLVLGMRVSDEAPSSCTTIRQVYVLCSVCYTCRCMRITV